VYVLFIFKNSANLIESLFNSIQVHFAQIW